MSQLAPCAVCGYPTRPNQVGFYVCEGVHKGTPLTDGETYAKGLEPERIEMGKVADRGAFAERHPIVRKIVRRGRRSNRA